MTALIIQGKKIAQEIKDEVKKELAALVSKTKIQPRIITITVGKNPASELYRKLRDVACAETGFLSQHIDFVETASEQQIIKKIDILNQDESVHGILIQYPVPNHISQTKLMQCIHPKKDVEGFHPMNLGNLCLGNEQLVPCTPQAVCSIIEHEHIPIQGKDVVIINHSIVVGRPLLQLLLNRNASTSVCHIYTKNLLSYTTPADIIISAAGVPKLITEKHIKENATIIDVGINQTPSGVCGDVDFDSVITKAKRITPVPGGVGPVTIACSVKNMLKVYKDNISEL